MSSWQSEFIRLSGTASNALGWNGCRDCDEIIEKQVAPTVLDIGGAVDGPTPDSFG